MNKVAILADQHIGYRNDSQHFSEYCLSFYEEKFFPFLLKNDIKTIYHLGDVFDRRKYINFHILSTWRTRFFDWLENHDIKLVIILGNHDVYYKNTNHVNGVEELLSRYKNIDIVSKPTNYLHDSHKICLVPWIPKGEEESAINFCKTSPAQICFGHFELLGFYMFSDTQNSHHGLDRNFLQHFDVVLSGHFHHKSTSGNITYVGSPYQMNWNDYGDERGFHIFDFEKRDLKFYPNDNELFIKVYYNDKDESFDSYMNQFNFSSYHNKFIKIIVEAKTNPYLYDIFLDKIYSVTPHDISVVESFLHEKEDTDIDLVKDTFSLISDYLKSLKLPSETEILTCMKTLYEECQAESFLIEN